QQVPLRDDTGRRSAHRECVAPGPGEDGLRRGAGALQPAGVRPENPRGLLVRSAGRPRRRHVARAECEGGGRGPDPLAGPSVRPAERSPRCASVRIVRPRTAPTRSEGSSPRTTTPTSWTRSPASSSRRHRARAGVSSSRRAARPQRCVRAPPVSSSLGLRMPGPRRAGPIWSHDRESPHPPDRRRSGHRRRGRGGPCEVTAAVRDAPLRALVPLVLCAAMAADARAQERLVRRFATDEGLGAPAVSTLAQDGSNALWIGTKGGLYRFDGAVFRRWAPEQVTGPVARVAAAADGRVAAQTEDGAIFTVTRNGATPVPPPPGGWSRSVYALAYDGGGGLWTVAGDTALARHDGKGWTVLPRGWHGGERPRVIRSAADGGILVLTDAGLWHIDAGGGPGRKRFGTLLMDALSFPDGRLVVLTADGRVVELVEGRQRELASRARGHIPNGRAIMLVERAGTYWIAMDRYLIAVRPGPEVEWIGSVDGLESGGPLLVDHEGSLWLGTFAALLQYPEPGTVVWTDRAGLPGRHVRYIARSGDVLWVTSWQGTARVRRAGTRLDIATVTELSSRSRPCADQLGVVWLSVEGGHAVRVRGDRRLGVAGAAPAGFNSCATTPGPTMWIGSQRGLLRADVQRGELRRVKGVPFGDDAPVHAVLEDRAGRLWAASGERVCYAPATAALEGDARGWACELIPGAGEVTSFFELEDGGLRASTRHVGVVARGADGWLPLPRNAELASRDVFGLVPLPAGGDWVAGSGILLLVRRRGSGGGEELGTSGAASGLPQG